MYDKRNIRTIRRECYRRLAVINCTQSHNARYWLDSYPSMYDLVALICEDVHEYFSAMSPTLLHLTTTFGAAGDPSLMLMVNMKDYPDRLFDHIRKITTPFEEALAVVPGNFFVTSDFRPLGDQNVGGESN